MLANREQYLSKIRSFFVLDFQKKSKILELILIINFIANLLTNNIKMRTI